VKRLTRTGPKRRRWRRRDWSGSGGDGQVRRWGATDVSFKREREARRAGLTGKITKHPGRAADPSGAYATTYGREADSDSLADKEEREEEENEK
jgi:hypothetical protein